MPDAVQYRALQDIQNRIRGLNLHDLNPANVAFMNVATDRGRKTELGTLPAVLIAPMREQIPPLGGTNSLDDIIYPFFIGIFVGNNQGQAVNETWLNWRMNIRRAFHNTRLGPLTTECVRVTVVPGDAVNQEAFYANLFNSWLIAQIVCREARAQG